ncbi:MAG: cupin domain-containing protein [Candidatus Eremiobacteraeota bacterium]|nr:cupin domain-containing protein [Candidatus Eremiobacteraeota bacterium]MBC5803590.1 cupin domain-containing protein [Candidatus Eremiobacteraeota bacterium]MBC5822669.1 cupin domain-containing protein [Candidatus Eremiobacteraeota bacterium]
MQQTVVPGVAMWSQWQAQRNLFFNSFCIATEEGTLVVDPLAPDETDLAELQARGVAWIALTNRDHERGARALAERVGAKLVASEGDAPLLTSAVDRIVRDGDDICGARVIALDGLKTPGEFALHFPDRKTVIVGDALWGDPAGSLRLMPDENLSDPPRAVLSLRKLRALRPEHLLLGDGTCIFGNAHQAIWAALEARHDAYVNRINVDEALWEKGRRDKPPYDAEAFDVDGLIGAEKLGYQLGRLAPGTSFCPEHWHLAEEELFVVLEGGARLVTPRGTWPLRRGDLVAFPTRPSGSHRLVNDGDVACVFLAVANVDERDVCFYPNSRKLLLEKTGQLVRDNPLLDYYDGE